MEPSFAISAVVFACVFGSALLGTFLRASVPVDHLGSEGKDVVKLAIGLVATMAALVLGLLTASAKGSFDTLDSEIKQSAAHIVLLDRILAQYGPETGEARTLLRQVVALRVKLTWPEDASKTQIEVPQTTANIEAIQAKIRELTPQNDGQRSVQAQAVTAAGNLAEARWLVFAQLGNTIPTPFLVVLILWLIVLFASFGLLAPRNTTVLIILAICGLSVSGSIFLILEMSQPLTGMIKVSSAPLHYALNHLGQ